MKINDNNPNNLSIIGINPNYWGLLKSIAFICTNFYNVYNSINLDYCFAKFAFLLLQLIVIIVIIGILCLGLSLNGGYNMWLADKM